MPEEKKPRICYILPRFDPATGSHFFHIYELLSRAAGYLDIRLVIERSSRAPRELAAPYYCQRFSFAPLRFLELLFILLKERLAGRRFFYTHYSFYGAFASWLVSGIFGGTAYYWNCGMPWFYRRSFVEERVFRFILRHTILVTGTAGLAKEYAFRYGLDSDRIRVMPNWINLSRFENSSDPKHFREHLGIPMDAKIALFVHRLSRRKGVHLLPEIIRQVTEKDKNVMFLIIGDGPEGESLKFKVKSLKLEPYVRLVGEVPNRELPSYYRVADVFIMPSEEEGFPHVLLEAMAVGVPYVASDVGGVREITPLQLQYFIVPSGNIDMFVQKILETLANPREIIAKISSSEQEWVKKYDIKAVLSQFIKLFEF